MTLLSFLATTDEPSDDRDSLTSEQADAIAELRLELASKLGHQCEECLIDAHVSRLLELMGDYSIETIIENQLLIDESQAHEHAGENEEANKDLEHAIVGHQALRAEHLASFQAEVLAEVEILSRSLEWDDLTRAIVVAKDSLPASRIPSKQKLGPEQNDLPNAEQAESVPVERSIEIVRSVSPISRIETTQIEATQTIEAASQTVSFRDFEESEAEIETAREIQPDLEVPHSTSGSEQLAAATVPLSMDSETLVRDSFEDLQAPFYESQIPDEPELSVGSAGGSGPIEPPKFFPPEPDGLEPPRPFGPEFGHRFESVPAEPVPEARVAEVPTLDREVATSYEAVLVKPFAKVFGATPPPVRPREIVRRTTIMAREAQRQRLVPIQVNESERRALQPQVPKLVNYSGAKGLDRGPALRRAAVTKATVQKLWVYNPHDDPEKKRREYAASRMLNVNRATPTITKTTPVLLKSKEEVTVAKETIEILDGCRGCTGGRGCCPTDRTDDFARNYGKTDEPTPLFEPAMDFNMGESSFFS